MMNIITAAEFVARIKANGNLFEVPELTEVTGKVELLPGRIQNLHLGSLIFEEIDLINTDIDDLYCGSVQANKLNCNSAKIKHFNLADADICELDFGYAKIEDLSCGDSKIQWTQFKGATFEAVHAVNNPALAWVIQQYIQSKVQYGIDDAPPWLLERSPKMPGITC